MFQHKTSRRATTLLLSAGLAVVTIVAALAAAGPTWTTLAPMPVATEGGQTGVIGNTIVVAYGYSSGDTNLTRLYDIDANSWSPGATAPGPKRSEGTAVTHGGNLYAIGGRPQGSVGNRIDRYNLASDSWNSTLASMPTARAGLGSAVVGNAIYAIGGRTGFASAPCSGSPTNAVERYDGRPAIRVDVVALHGLRW